MLRLEAHAAPDAGVEISPPTQTDTPTIPVSEAVQSSSPAMITTTTTPTKANTPVKAKPKTAIKLKIQRRAKPPKASSSKQATPKSKQTCSDNILLGAGEGSEGANVPTASKKTPKRTRAKKQNAQLQVAKK
ncbi:uncharacterized protein BROUX77_000340 [Berkeleyomyces rouxiae]|uniref:uncharacterized protein n=1 Tax=Berkeleyomyces rouxiae TaxID=2035830 RepID=UPI003B769D69